MLAEFLRSIPPGLRPRLVRGDVGFGNETTILACELAGEPYLFKVRRSRSIQELFDSAGSGDWLDAGEGWESFETVSTFQTWTKARRLVFFRRPDPDAKSKTVDAVPVLPGLFVEKDPPARQWEWYALVTDLEASPWTVGALYRERGDCGTASFGQPVHARPCVPGYWIATRSADFSHQTPSAAAPSGAARPAVGLTRACACGQLLFLG